MTEEKSVLRWGGLAGMAAPILSILTAVTMFGFLPSAPAGPHGPVVRYPEVREAFVLAESFALASLVFGVAFTIGLLAALRRASPAPAYWAAGLGFMSLAVFAVEAVPRVVFLEISDLYHAPGATAQDQATLALIWQTTQSMFYQLDTAGVIFSTLGYILAGIAMLRHPAFGKRIGAVVIALALAALVGLFFLGVHSLSYAPLGLFVLIILPLTLGWKLYRLSR